LSLDLVIPKRLGLLLKLKLSEDLSNNID